MKEKLNKGFTLIELIIVMVILGIMAAVAVPRYLDSISNAEKSAEDAVINNIKAGLKQYANNKLYESGRPEWPNNPFDALSEKPAGYSGEYVSPAGVAEEDGEWTFMKNGDGTGLITHQRADNSRYQWAYDKGIQNGTDSARVGTLGLRTLIGQN